MGHCVSEMSGVFINMPHSVIVIFKMVEEMTQN